MKSFYVPVKLKFGLSTLFAIAWTVFSVWLAGLWIIDLTAVIGVFWAWTIIGGIAIVPGFMSAFLLASLLLDSRPPRRKDLQYYPPITLLIAALLNYIQSVGLVISPASAVVSAK